MNENVTRWPLVWPDGWKRTPPHQRQAPRFSRKETHYGEGNTSWTNNRHLSFTEACDRLERQVALFHAERPIISSNVELSLRGSPIAREGDKKLADPGVSLYFTLRGQARCLACDLYTTPAGNIAAIAAHIDALRRIDRYGVGTLDQAFAGYAPRLQSASFEWWIVLGVARTASRDAVDAAYTALARTAHPDQGGSHDAMARLSEARQHAYVALGVR